MASTATTTTTTNMSVSKMLAHLLALPANRSCADCRVTLVDSSQVYASYSPTGADVVEEGSGEGTGFLEDDDEESDQQLQDGEDKDDNDDDENDGAVPTKGRFTDLMQNHAQFAPPGYEPSSEHFHIDPPPPLPRKMKSVSSSNSGRQTSTSSSVSASSRKARLSTISTSQIPEENPLQTVRERGYLGHGVFVCAMCAAAHKLMNLHSHHHGSTSPSAAAAGACTVICQVDAVQDTSAWNAQNVAQLAATGNSHSWKVLEAHFTGVRPKATTAGVAERLIFCRAKYQVYAFVFPPLSPVALPFHRDVWTAILNQHAPWTKALWGGTAAPLQYSLADLQLAPTSPLLLGNVKKKRNALSDSASSSVTSAAGTPLPNRLVDYFCVVSAGDKLDPRFVREHGHDLSQVVQSANDVLLAPVVTDCYPAKQTAAYSDMDFPEHVGSFVYPEGCRPSNAAMSPQFFTLVLTCADGSRLYGGALKLHDKTLDTVQGLRRVFANSNYSGPLPPWLQTDEEQQHDNGKAAAKPTNELCHWPKCLVVLSHYPFFDIFRKFLLHIYRIALTAAPLPMERFVANFCSEVPLPPPGRVQVRFGFTAHSLWTLQRPPDNELPLANFSYQPLFACLSLSSVLVVLGCLLQETRVVLVSQYYALLTPVAEALLSLLFPLHWTGMYIPIMPSSMLDILDAPVPFLVGLHSKYLSETPPNRRPLGVVFVDLDQDIVHLGWSDEEGLPSPGMAPNEPRRTPALPERDATKLKNRLVASGAASSYIMPTGGKAARITYGENDQPLPFGERDGYSHITSSEVPAAGIGTAHKRAAVQRKEFFQHVDRAYGDEKEGLVLSPEDFLTGQGLFHEKTLQGSASQEQSSANLGSGKRSGSKTAGGGSGSGGGNKGGLVRRLLSSPQKSTASEGDAATGTGGTATTASASSSSSVPTASSVNLLDARDPKNFSVAEVRNAFLRFFVGMFRGYRDFIDYDEGTFRTQEFLACMFNTATSNGTTNGNGSAPGSNASSSMVVSNPAAVSRCQAYMQRVLETQMFERFLQERIENAHDPEVLFFDVSINAKENRFARKTPFKILRNGGFKDTSFLNDTSQQVSEQYTPPPPSHWGLPDDGRVYQYGTFPELDPQLYGKVRPPIVWPEYSTKHYSTSIRQRTRSRHDALAQKQQSLVNGLMLQASAAATSPREKKGPSILDKALLALAQPYMPQDTNATRNKRTSSPTRSQRAATSVTSKSVTLTTYNNTKVKALPAPTTNTLVAASTTTPSSLATAGTDFTFELDSPTAAALPSTPFVAEEVVLNARRRAGMIVALLVNIQAQSRGYLERKGVAVGASTALTSWTQSGEGGALSSDDEHTIVFFQSAAERQRLAAELEKKRQAGATKLQAVIRRVQQRLEYCRAVQGLLRLQAVIRARLTRLAYLLLVRRALPLVQAVVRGRAVRHDLATVLSGRLLLYRKQVFILWKRAHTSLAYRTKFWTLVLVKEPPNMLRHNLAEAELERLRNELSILADQDLTDKKKEDTLYLLAQKLGLPQEQYAACVNLDQSLEVDREEDFSVVSSFASISLSSRSVSITSSEEGRLRSRAGGGGVSFLLASERTQIYERLSQSTGNEQVTKLYDTFSIGLRDKKRKKALAEAVWRHLEQADESAALMYQLFPELRHSDTLKFVEPSRKGMRRFQFDVRQFAVELETTGRPQKWLNDQMRKNVGVVASLALCQMPRLLDKYNNLGSKREIGTVRQRQACTVARGFQEWEQCRLYLMTALVRNDMTTSSTGRQYVVSPYKGAAASVRTTPRRRRRRQEDDAKQNAILKTPPRSNNPFEAKTNPFEAGESSDEDSTDAGIFMPPKRGGKRHNSSSNPFDSPGGGENEKTSSSNVICPVALT